MAYAVIDDHHIIVTPDAPRVQVLDQSSNNWRVGAIYWFCGHAQFCDLFLNASASA